MIRKILIFWLFPFTIGVCLAIGYKITNHFLKAENQQNKLAGIQENIKEKYTEIDSIKGAIQIENSNQLQRRTDIKEQNNISNFAPKINTSLMKNNSSKNDENDPDLTDKKIISKIKLLNQSKFAKENLSNLSKNDDIIVTPIIEIKIDGLSKEEKSFFNRLFKTLPKP
ncbi:hypothetical protein [Prochlorococcus marinus]|uniref:hypothetical protein n=1 Tax=Prochlorococcus marinus TaxID=1219 RepID=UPI0022B2EA59|nr:hypothetical protein [Prochlorococcus marinus]